MKQASKAPASSPAQGASPPGTASTTIALAIRTTKSEPPNRSAALWSPLAAVRAAIQSIFPDLEGDALEAIRMTACELGENVLKYGEPSDGVAGELTISRAPGQVEIRTSNRLTDAKRAAHLLELVDRIANTSDLRGPFIARMAQIMEQPEQPSTALGLLRVGYEGLFELSARYDGATMTVIGTRSLR